MGWGTGKTLLKLGEWSLEERKEDGRIEGSGVRHKCDGWTYYRVRDGVCWGCNAVIPNEILALWILHNDKI